MLEASTIGRLQKAAAANVWESATDIRLHIKVERSDPLDRFRVDELAKAVRLRSAVSIKGIVAGLG